MKKNSKHIWLSGMMYILLYVCILSPKLVVQAGEINNDEAGVIAAASGTFTYDGKTYRADPAYIESLKDYLASDDVDLTAGQASSAISQMYASVAQGVEQGYLYEVGGQPGTTEATTEPVSSGIVLGDGRGTTSDMGKGNAAKEEKLTSDGKKQDSDSKARNNYAQNSNDASGAEQIESDKQIHLDKNAEELDNSAEEDYSGTIAKLFSDSKKHSKEETKNSFIIVLILLSILCVLALTVWAVKVVLRKRRAAPYLLALKDKGLTDLHCHILPGVDDGSKDMETSMKMLEIGYQNGIRRIIATPHYISNHLKYDEDKLQKVFTAFTEEVYKVYPDMECYLGNELYVQGQVLEDVKAGKVHTMADSKYLLVEFSTKIAYHDMYKEMKNIVQARYYPILAHMERFQCLTKHPERVDELAELGVYFQMNADSVLGKGADKKWCRKMLKENRIQFLGTDAHGTTHRTPKMEQAVKWIYENIEPWDAEDLLINNPKKILNKERID